VNNNDSFLVRYSTPEASVLGFQQGREFKALADASAGGAHKLNGLGSTSGQPVWLLSADAPPAAELSAALERMAGESVELWTINPQTPIGTQEVWAAGVTYKRSEEAREAESNNSTIYTRVYSAARPELFFKSNGAEVVPLGEPVGIRCDATWSVPEPELVVVVNARMEVVGFTIGNDMSSRDIEGENPLYLPQAKNYDRACALGPRIWLQPGATRFPDVEIELKIERGGEVVFSGTTSSEQIHRPLNELVEYLGRCKSFPRGVLLFTGTGIVPPDSFTLVEGDKVRIRIDPIGELINTVSVVGKCTEGAG
jgi:2-dehydro-3-deoxy-D-arabinonate dehydratase